MKDKIIYTLGTLCYVTVALYLFNIFFYSTWMETTYSILAALLLLFAIFSVRKSNQIIIIVLLSVGFYLYITEKVDVDTIILGFGKNINLLSIFILIPLIAIYINIAGYTEALKQKIMEIEQKSSSKPYSLSFLLILSMGTVLNLGSMAVIYNIAKRSFANYYQKKLVIIILRAFGFCMFWSPYFVNIGLVLVLFHVSWIEVGWLGIVIGIVYALISAIFFPITNFKDDQFIARKKSQIAKRDRKLYPLILYGGLLLVISLLLDYFMEVSMLTIVSILGFFYPLIWAIMTKRGKQYVSELISYMKTSFQRLKNEITVFVSAGFFGAALSETNIGDKISEMIFYLSFDSIFIMSIIIILFAISLSMLGIHPVVIVTGIGSALSPQFFGVSPQFMALLLIVAWTLATQSSPFAGSILMASSLVNQSPWEITRYNLPFTLVCTVVLSLLLYSLFIFGII